jgi:hypothetical protein
LSGDLEWLRAKVERIPGEVERMRGCLEIMSGKVERMPGRLEIMSADPEWKTAALERQWFTKLGRGLQVSVPKLHSAYDMRLLGETRDDQGQSTHLAMACTCQMPLWPASYVQ